MKPWKRGYQEYKNKYINKILDTNDFDPAHLPQGYGFRLDERVIEYPWFFSRLPVGEGKLLDAGSVLNMDFVMSHKSLSKKQIFISTLAPEAVCFWKKRISYLFEDLRDTCFKENYFDWIVCISTLEHIGMDNSFIYTNDDSFNENYPSSYKSVVGELKRVLKKNGILYLSMPYGKAKNHGWFQIFDSNMLDTIINIFSPSSVTESHFRYTPEGWSISSREMSSNATYFDIHSQKSYDKDFAAASRAVVCLELVK